MHNTYPFPGDRRPILASNAMVATSQPLAAQAGLRMLLAGGNAVDAALASALALTVLEPTSNGIGGDAFALVWDGQSLQGLNGSGAWPAGMAAEGLRERGHQKIPETGWEGVTVPGAPAAWQALHERYGRLDFGQIAAPAIDYAQSGFPVSPVIAYLWARSKIRFDEARVAATSGWYDYFAPGHKTPRPGERFCSPGHGACLRRLAKAGVRDFYEGEVAERLADYARKTGGRLTAADLANHHSEWVDPICASYGGHELWQIPPNAQGIAALEALGILEGMNLADHPPGSAAAWHLQIEAMKLAFADAYRYVGDRRYAEVPVEGLLAPEYLAQRRALMGERAGTPSPGLPPGGGTVYLCTADAEGMMVSYIQSNYQGFGSGVVVPDLGISLHNRGVCFTLEAGHANEAAPGKRPRHTIIPAFLTRGGEPVGPLGVMGGEMQPQGHVQVVSSMVDHGLDPQAALDAPRWQIVEGGGLSVEPEVPAEVVAALGARGHEVTVAPDRVGFGRGQIIERTAQGVYVAGSEPRADGQAVGY